MDQSSSDCSIILHLPEEVDSSSSLKYGNVLEDTSNIKKKKKKKNTSINKTTRSQQDVKSDQIFTAQKGTTFFHQQEGPTSVQLQFFPQDQPFNNPSQQQKYISHTIPTPVQTSKKSTNPSQRKISLTPTFRVYKPSDKFPTKAIQQQEQLIKESSLNFNNNNNSKNKNKSKVSFDPIITTATDFKTNGKANNRKNKFLKSDESDHEDSSVTIIDEEEHQPKKLLSLNGERIFIQEINKLKNLTTSLIQDIIVLDENKFHDIMDDIIKAAVKLRYSDLFNKEDP